MNNLITTGFIFITLTLGGFYLAYRYGKNTKKIRWNEYLALIIIPILAVLTLSYLFNERILALFLISAFVGTLLEYLIGLAYHKTLNQRLFTYNRLSMGGYTSLLSIPIWGVAGVMFWFISKMVGL
ncbi:hypothetical protein HYV91_00960 [Candidatus Wolfebacteria bacterium]|nr:hypothetical protein [Candidatus Wolfebacteria bacterium]